MLIAIVWDRSHVQDWLVFGIGLITMFWGFSRAGGLHRLSTRLVQTAAATAYTPARALWMVKRAKPTYHGREPNCHFYTWRFSDAEVAATQRWWPNILQTYGLIF